MIKVKEVRIAIEVKRSDAGDDSAVAMFCLALSVNFLFVFFVVIVDFLPCFRCCYC